MDINTYLHYNNVALIDPSEEFHASCIKMYQSKGYLTPNQLLSLRNWAHSTSTIERLTAGISPAATTPVVGTIVEPMEPVSVKNTRWSDAEIENLCTLVESGTTELSMLSELTGRKETSVQNVLYRNAGACTFKKGHVIQFERIPF